MTPLSTRITTRGDDAFRQPLALDLDEAGVPETGLDRLGHGPVAFDGHQNGPAVGAGDEALFGHGQDAAALLRDDPDVQELPGPESGARGEGRPDKNGVGPGIDVPSDDEDGSGGRAPIAPDDRLPRLEPRRLAAGHPGRHDEAVESDDLGQDRVRLDRLADPGPDPDDRSRERRSDLEQGKLGAGRGKLAPRRVER
ncbi:MAG: hypothetical protein H6P95_677 [Candidatus Aminicenantes bacterium]|nr:hypothetical protein [Candidatus Aminicenantes bacterium]